MSLWRRGDIVELDGLLAVVTAVEGDPEVPKGHVTLWFGEPRCKRKSEGGIGGARPEVCTVPEEYCVYAATSITSH